ncbi:hypothetical protein SLEP1_g35067 [Rubroshorea leprosula]|uniref:Uncharacterized protein n=1 Tax=Rubroshorea leprosula TaxID=152421 RepID=A0AAV5KMC2_9ROSI|nr:hypothetical protein SLEP1_g35067 [Rubroshorea leprosula]
MRPKLAPQNNQLSWCALFFYRTRRRADCRIGAQQCAGGCSSTGAQAAKAGSKARDLGCRRHRMQRGECRVRPGTGAKGAECWRQGSVTGAKGRKVQGWLAVSKGHRGAVSVEEQGWFGCEGGKRFWRERENEDF